MSEGIKFFDPNLNTPVDKVSFYKTGDAEGHLSIKWPLSFTTIRMSVEHNPKLIDKKNAIYFRTSNGMTKLWNESEGVNEIILDELDAYGDGELMFVERSGVFILDKVWVR